jgi:hypothetical protein
MTRTIYTPSGKFNLSAMWPMLFLLMGVSGLLAVIFALLTRVDFYVILWTWIPAAFLCIHIGNKATEEGKCRNPLIIGSFVFVCCLVMWLGIYHVDQCTRWNIPWTAIDRLPGYITFRMETDGWFGYTKAPVVWAVPHDLRIDPYITPRITPTVRWISFLGELIALVLVPTVTCWRRARRPFSEQLEQWFAETKTSLTQESAHLLTRALLNQTIPDWVKSRVVKSAVESEGVIVSLFYCPKTENALGLESQMFIKVGNSQLMLLDIAESAALTELFPELSCWMERPIELEGETQRTDLSQTPPPARTDVATFQHVPPPHCGRLKDPQIKKQGRRGTTWIMLKEQLRFPLLFAAVIMGIFFPFAQIGSDFWTIVGAIIALVVLVIGVIWINRMYPSNVDDPLFQHLISFYHKQMLIQAEQRSDALFPIDAPGVCYAEYVPRQQWAKLDSDEPVRLDEGGLMLFDDANARLLFEGDRYRWVIPYACIKFNEIETVDERLHFYAVVIQFLTANGRKELPLLANTGVPGLNRVDRANALYAMIAERIAPYLAPPETPAYSEQPDVLL